MEELTYGYLKPGPGDKGSAFWDALRQDIQKMNDHKHDGETGSLLDSSNVSAVVGTTIAAADWGTVLGNGLYRQLVTMPYITGSSPQVRMDYDTYRPVFRFSGGSFDGQEASLTTTKVSDSTYYVYCNDNTQALTVIYV